MDKRELFCLFLAVFIGLVNKSLAQTSSGAYQRIELHIQPSIEISSINASEVQLSVENKKSKKAVTSGQEFRIRSNKDFVVKVSSADPYFTNTANSTRNAGPSVSDNLYMAIAGNFAGGTSTQQLIQGYTPVSTETKDILMKGKGGEQTFAVNYKMKGNKKYDNGNYAVGIIYTATEP